MAEIYKVAESWMSIWVRTGPGTRYSKKSVIYGRDNREYEVTERQNNYWLNIPSVGGWCCDRDSNGMIVMKKTGTSSASSVTPEQEKPLEQVDEETYAYVPDSEMISLSEEEFETALNNNFDIASLRGIFGMPYQFMESADPRLTSAPNAIGRKYAREIVENMPLLLIMPGKPIFMGTYSKKDKETILGQLINGAAGYSSQITDLILDNENFGKYYSLEPSSVEYYGYVNPMCRIAARLLNLQDITIDGEKLDNIEWSSQVNKNFTKLFSVYHGCTAWYCDSETQISDSWDNGTSQSMIAEKVNSLSDYGRELNFILGTAKAQTGYALDAFTSEENLASNIENVNSFINGVLGQGSVSNIFKTITNSIQTVVAGGKLVFPEIWSDSSFARSYDIKLKLVSPDADDLSIYLNIIVPILHLLGLVLPRQAKDTRGYTSPFLVRGFYKGLFNVDMGIITNMSITKGKEAAWNNNGLPLVAEVSFTIKDLYSDMYMTNMDGLIHNTMSNIILMDYIGNLCGININEVDVYRAVDMFLTMNIQNRAKDTWRMKIIGNLEQWVNKKYLDIFGRF